jgi:aspartate kinase
VVKDAQKLTEISYDEMLELASLGSKVMQTRSVEFAAKYGVVFEVRSSFNNNPGTIVKQEVAYMEKVLVRGVAVDKDQAKVVVSNIADKPGTAAKRFPRAGRRHHQRRHDRPERRPRRRGEPDVHRAAFEKDKAVKALPGRAPEVGGEATFDEAIAKLSVVGVGMKTHSGVAAALFEALAEGRHQHRAHQHLRDQDLPRDAKRQADEAARVAHEAFGLDKMG